MGRARRKQLGALMNFRCDGDRVLHHRGAVAEHPIRVRRYRRQVRESGAVGGGGGGIGRRTPSAEGLRPCPGCRAAPAGRGGA